MGLNTPATNRGVGTQFEVEAHVGGVPIVGLQTHFEHVETQIKVLSPVLRVSYHRKGVMEIVGSILVGLSEVNSCWWLRANAKALVNRCFQERRRPMTIRYHCSLDCVDWRLIVVCFFDSFCILQGIKVVRNGRFIPLS